MSSSTYTIANLIDNQIAAIRNALNSAELAIRELSKWAERVPEETLDGDPAARVKFVEDLERGASARLLIRSALSTLAV